MIKSLDNFRDYFDNKGNDLGFNLCIVPQSSVIVVVMYFGVGNHCRIKKDSKIKKEYMRRDRNLSNIR